MNPLNDIVVALTNLKETDACNQILSVFAKHISNLNECETIAMNFLLLKNYEQALIYTQKCFEYNPNNEQINALKYNLVNVFVGLNEPEEAIKILDSINPSEITTRLKKSYCLFLLGERDESEKILRNELNNNELKKPENIQTLNEINFNLNVYEFYRDNFHKGLERYFKLGKKLNFWKKPRLPFHEWDGNYNHKDIIVLRSEAGIGDEIINVRFMKNFENLGLKPLWFTDRKDVYDVFNRLGYRSVMSVEEIKQLWQGEDIHWIHSMDCPLALKLEYKDLWPGPYIKPLDKQSHIRLSSRKIKVGLRWQGNPGYANDLHRTIPLDKIYEAIKNFNFDLYSLQRDEQLEILSNYPIITPLHEISLTTLEDTLVEINDLDLVITSCTSIAHLSAAMGKKTVVLVPLSAYYIWCHSGNISPWYGDHVKILRQRKPRSWEEPIQELINYLNLNFNNEE